MKLLFVSNYYNHHQTAISRYLHNKTHGNFAFVATGKMSAERKRLGYQSQEHEWVRYIPRTEDGKAELTQLANSYDVIVAGSVPEKMISDIRKNPKFLIFKYSERPFKKKDNFFKNILHFVKFRYYHRHLKSTYLLCSSAYTSYDYSKMWLYKNKAYKWGYFPETKKYESITQLMDEKNSREIMWCGRLLDWKHPDDVIHVAKMLKDAGYNFNIKFVGNGEMSEQLHDMVEQYELQNCVHLLGSTTPDKVRWCMESAGIFMFTSDRNEGWGAVLNEAMNSGCAVVASHAIGSVPYLVKNNDNGLVYNSGDVNMLFEKVKYLLDNPNEQRRLGMSAYETITETWNAEVAAERLIHLSECIIAGEKHPELYEYGPCSKAKIIKDNWLKLDENKT